jgi:hypothetical protein
MRRASVPKNGWRLIRPIRALTIFVGVSLLMFCVPVSCERVSQGTAVVGSGDDKFEDGVIANLVS